MVRLIVLLKIFLVKQLLCCLWLIRPAFGQNLYFPPLQGSEWEAIEPSTLNWNIDLLDTLYDYLESENSRAFIVLVDGRLAIEKYFHGHTVNRPWYWASAGKSLTAFAIGVAQQEGLLNIRLPSKTYLGDAWSSCDSDEEEAIQVWHHLTMTTGLDEKVANSDCTADTCLICLYEPGTRWYYHNAPYTLLEQVIANASGSSLNSFVNQRILAKTGMTGAYIPLGFNQVFWSVPRSMARFGLLVLNHGIWSQDTLMSDSSYFYQMTKKSQDLNPAYGYLWWLNGEEKFRLPGSNLSFTGQLLPSAPRDLIAALGANGQILNVIPSLNMVLLRLGESPESASIGIQLNRKIWEIFSRAIDQNTSQHTYEQSIQNPSIKVIYDPGQTRILVQWPEQEFNAALFNSSGQVFSSFPTQKEEHLIYVQSQKPGLYFLRLTNLRGLSSFHKIVLF